MREAPDGTPSGFSYRGKIVMVKQISQQWRIRERWWRSEIVREYYQLETSRFICMVYRDLVAGDWYLQRIYD